MSANLIVDIGGTAVFLNSLIPPSGGVVAGLSGTGAWTIGSTCDLINANTATQLEVTGVPLFNSGLMVGVQTSDSDTSGNFTDPTSGIGQLPSWFSSGGFIWVNSGGTGGIQNSGALSGYQFLSGFVAFAMFQRPHRFVRAIFPPSTSGNYYAGSLTASFVGGNRTTGSGGGFTYSPGSGTVNV